MTVVPITDAMQPLDYALAYARIGWHVFPVEAGTKQPLGRLAPRGFLDATTDAGQIRRWWATAPDASIGVAMGASGLVAIDIDPRNGGLYTMELLEAEHGGLDSAVLAYTGGGGEHRIFSLAADAAAGLPGKLGPGVDVKWNGYILVEPSIHPSGKGYQWEASSSPLDGIAPTPLPDWIRGHERLAGTRPRADRSGQWVPITDTQWAELDSALQRIDSDSRDTWVQVGMALHSTGELQRAYDLWCRWSQQSPKFDARDQLRVWRSFKADGLAGTTYRTIFAMAQPEPGAVALAAATPQDDGISATPFAWRDPSSIPPRRWLYGQHYIRKFLTATVAPGGVGKSSLILVELVSIVLGVDLLNDREPLPGGPKRVWLYALEDPRDEIERRLAALLVHYGIKPAEVEGRLFIDSGRERPLVVAIEDRGTFVAVPKARDALVREIRAKAIDVLCLDPYVSTHRVAENDNTKQDAVAQIWKQIADECDVSIEMVHHVRKGNGSGAEIGADDMRGAAAVRDACRSVRIVANMTEDEARGFSIEPERRRFYLYVKDAKANLAPPVDRRQWLHLASIDLCNGDGVYPSDRIGVIEAWQAPDALDAVTAQDLIAVCMALRGMDDTARLLRAACNAGNAGWFGHLVGERLGLNANDAHGKQQIKRVLAAWKKAKVLKEDTVTDKVKGRKVPVYALGSAAP